MELLKIREHGNLIQSAAAWFHAKWGVPVEAYEESMAACLDCGESVSQWYAAFENGAMIGGVGVIENDFHQRKDLTPNVCALYVEAPYRGKGIAGKLLRFVCDDRKAFGVDTLYLVTDHTSFYERYGWTFYGMVRESEGPGTTRMYVHKQ